MYHENHILARHVDSVFHSECEGQDATRRPGQRCQLGDAWPSVGGPNPLSLSLRPWKHMPSHNFISLEPSPHKLQRTPSTGFDRRIISALEPNEEQEKFIMMQSCYATYVTSEMVKLITHPQVIRSTGWYVIPFAGKMNHAVRIKVNWSAQFSALRRLKLK